MTPGSVSPRVISRRLKMIQDRLMQKHGALAEDGARTLHRLAGYRNRMVHFCCEVSEEELYRICVRDLGDVEQIGDAYRRWVKQHPDKMEQA